jgi:hypothetical protein
MSRLLRFCLVSVLSLAGGSAVAYAYDNRVDPNAARRTEFTFSFPRELGVSADDKTNLPREYASAMTFYRVALADGYTQPPILGAPRSYDEQLPKPLHWAWIADNGDLITRVGKGIFRLSFADNGSNLFRDLDCRLVSWPGGDSEAPMVCNDGSQRKMQIPGDGIVLVDDVQYTRVFNSDETTLPPEEVFDVDKMTAAAVDAATPPARDGSTLVDIVPAAGPVLPETAPIPPAR